MTCAVCGAIPREGDLFCARCGTKLEPSDPLLEEDAWPEGLDLEPETPQPGATTSTNPPAHPVGASTEVLPTLPPPATARPRSRDDSPRHGGGGFPAGASIALLGGMGVVLSALLPWIGRPAEVFPKAIPSLYLVGSDGGPSLAVVLLMLGSAGALVAIASMLVPPLLFLRRILGSLTLTLLGIFLARTALDLPEGARLLASLGPGAFVAGAGGLLEAVAGRWFRR